MNTTPLECQSLTVLVIFVIDWYPEVVMDLSPIYNEISLTLGVRDVMLLATAVDKVKAPHEVEDYTLKHRNECILINLVAKDSGMSSDQKLKGPFLAKDLALDW